MRGKSDRVGAVTCQLKISHWLSLQLRSCRSKLVCGLRDMLLERRTASGLALAPITEADAVRWALEFASSSFGDPLLASAISLLLLLAMPPGVQVLRLPCTLVAVNTLVKL